MESYLPFLGIPVLNILGAFIKKAKFIPNDAIPLILVGAGIAGAEFMGVPFEQGMAAAAGAGALYGGAQVVNKQIKKEK